MSTSAFQAPSVRELWPVLTAQRLYHRPVFLGSEHIPRARPVLYVGNHTLFGVLDPPLLMAHIYEETGHLPRSLADHFHYRVPGWRDFLTRWGAVRGTRENCRAVMRAGDSVLVFPGGGREVAKRRGEAYQLLWKQRTGFVRMAVEHGYPIVPFASVGAEECYSIHLDANDLEELGVGNCLTRGLLGKVTRRWRATRSDRHRRIRHAIPATAAFLLRVRRAHRDGRAARPHGRRRRHARAAAAGEGRRRGAHRRLSGRARTARRVILSCRQVSNPLRPSRPCNR